MLVKCLPKLHVVSQAYLDFIQLGGRIRMEDLNAAGPQFLIAARPFSRA